MSTSSDNNTQNDYVATTEEMLTKIITSSDIELITYNNTQNDYVATTEEMLTKIITSSDIELITYLSKLLIDTGRIEYDPKIVQIFENYFTDSGIQSSHAFSILSKSSSIPRYATLLGFFYQYGIGTTQNEELAFQYYQSAADKGDSFSMIQVGWYYDNASGNPVRRDAKKALEYYKKSVETGNHPQALCHLAYHEQNERKMFLMYEEAAIGGFRDAQRQVIASYRYGSGIEKDLHKAFRLLWKRIKEKSKWNFNELEYLKLFCLGGLM
ncbi:2343_t:CDS:1 [Ambispora leptoticha]|uniref:2343_t:CDS:1 n=1 Tax=Ambispora leptoticha TaxID=144679 RepID=A0A9N9DKQ4_9GLOM|nr:2343_t:CDS:1 [Ambispora leptoticha]